MLARAGRRVLLVEKDRFPRDKVCGEFLSGESLRLLAELGCLEQVEAAGPARISRWRFTAPSGAVLERRLPRVSLGISRRTLDAILFRHAARSGADTLEGVEARRVVVTSAGRAAAALIVRHQRQAGDAGSSSPATSPAGLCGSGGAGASLSVESPIVLAAWGRRAAPDRELKRVGTGAGGARAAPYLGLKRHHRIASSRLGDECAEALDGCVEIHAVPDGYCGLNFIEGAGVANVCMLLGRAIVRRLGRRAGDWNHVCEALAASNPILGRRLKGLEPCEPRPHSVAQPPFGPRRPASGPIFFLGDAAGMIPPLCGDGQSMAINAAVDLAGLIAALPLSPRLEAIRDLGRSWDRLWRRRYGTRVWFGCALQAALVRPLVLEIGLRVLKRMPFAADGLARATRGD
ncbi:MAG: NAD(P)/FAD-dependent oxidoreductase [Candidatus Sumerlaeia bacterium]